MYGGLLAELAKQVAAEEFSRSVGQARDEAIRGFAPYYADIPNADTADVAVQFSESGLESPMFDPVDVLTSGVGGGVASMARASAKRLARQLADPFGDIARVYGNKAAKNFSYDMIDRDVAKNIYKDAFFAERNGGEPLSKGFEKGMKKAAEELKAEYRSMGTEPFEPKWNRTTRLTPEYGGATAGAIIDSNPYLRTEPSKKLGRLSKGKGSWVNDAFPYFGNKTPNNPMRDELAERLYDARFNDQISGDAVRSLMDMMYKEWR